MRAARRRHPLLIDALQLRLRKRPDYPALCAFTSRVALQSGHEALFYLALLDRAAQVRCISPYSLDAFPCKIVDPRTRKNVGQLRHLCLHLDGTYYFFQIGLMPGSVYCVDVLVWRDGVWSVLEIDGEGHDAGGDAERDAAIPLAVTRWSAGDVENFARGVERRSRAA